MLVTRLLQRVATKTGGAQSNLVESVMTSGGSLQQVRGPITIVAGKRRRLTFVECPQVRVIQLIHPTLSRPGAACSCGSMARNTCSHSSELAACMSTFRL
jgi:hypothetical protein